MTTPLCRETAIAVGIIMLIVLVALPLHPIAVISFETGILVGLFLHSSHTRAAVERGWLEKNDPNT